MKATGTSKELLSIKGDGSNTAIIKSLMITKSSEPAEKPKIFKIERSPLLRKLEQFVPEMKNSNAELLTKSEDELKKLDIENTENCSKVVEMNLLLGEMKDEALSCDCSSMDNDSECRSKFCKKVSCKNIIIPGNESKCEGASSNENKPNLIEVLSNGPMEVNLKSSIDVTKNID